MIRATKRYKTPRQLNEGQIWWAHHESFDEKSDEKLGAFLFRIVHKAVGESYGDEKGQPIWLGVKLSTSFKSSFKYDLNNKVRQCWWFDQNGIAVDSVGGFQFVLSHRVGVVEAGIIGDATDCASENPIFPCYSETKEYATVFSEIVDGKVELEVSLSNCNSSDEELLPVLQDILDFDSDVRLNFNFNINSILDDNFSDSFGYKHEIIDEHDKKLIGILRSDFQRQIDRIDAVLKK